VPFHHSGVNLAAPRTVKLSPTLLIRLFHKPCTTRGSGGLVSACPRTHAPRVAFRLGRHAGRFSHRNVKDHPHDPDILSLRQGKGLEERFGQALKIGKDQGSEVSVGVFAMPSKEQVGISGPLARFARALYTAIKKGRGDPTFSPREKVPRRGG